MQIESKKPLEDMRQAAEKILIHVLHVHHG